MKKKIARLLLSLANRLDRNAIDEDICSRVPWMEKIGLSIHISKKDVVLFRKDHPEVKSHREGLRVLTKEAKWRIAGAIARGLMEHDSIFFDVASTTCVANVSGWAFVHRRNIHVDTADGKGEDCSEKDAGE